MHVSGKFLVTLSRGYDRKLFLSFHDVHMIINYILNMDTYKSRSSNFCTWVLSHMHTFEWQSALFQKTFWPIFLTLPFSKVAERYKDSQLFQKNGLNQKCLFIVIKYRQNCFERFREFFGNLLPVFNIIEQIVLVQAVNVKRVSWGSLYISYTLAESWNIQGAVYTYMYLLFCPEKQMKPELLLKCGFLKESFIINAPLASWNKKMEGFAMRL